ncbi:MAG: metal-dependent transcriptional regulator [Candidatus Gastranaerophilales bacterium]|nr:metal-dependent transcriptional regulator [Candidatus Gastranaerophilales bacterium]MCM1073001.1 metal-dependent transcriptional regulator [Bacteroides sp.]
MKELTKSLEKYLAAIHEIIETQGAARVRDVSERVKANAASTSEAVKTLAKKGFVNYKPYGVITLTDKGLMTVESKNKRHEIIKNFLSNSLMLQKDYSDDLEFSMPDEVLERFVAYLTFMQKCSCKEPKWLKSFQYFINENKMPEKCSSCINSDDKTCCNCG